jgi:hypothetical protein
VVFVWYMVFTPLLTIFHLYRGGNRKTRRKLSTLPQVTDKFITLCCIEYTSPWTGFKLITLVVIGSDCTGSWKSNYHTITTTFNATFIIVSVISWWSVLLVEETRLRWENQQPSASKWQTLYHKVVSSTSRHERDLNPQL